MIFYFIEFIWYLIFLNNYLFDDGFVWFYLNLFYALCFFKLILKKSHLFNLGFYLFDLLGIKLNILNAKLIEYSKQLRHLSHIAMCELRCGLSQLRKFFASQF